MEAMDLTAAVAAVAARAVAALAVVEVVAATAVTRVIRATLPPHPSGTITSPINMGIVLSRRHSINQPTVTTAETSYGVSWFKDTFVKVWAFLLAARTAVLNSQSFGKLKSKLE